jgi:hypothetical protein
MPIKQLNEPPAHERPDINPPGSREPNGGQGRTINNPKYHDDGTLRDRDDRRDD